MYIFLLNTYFVQYRYFDSCGCLKILNHPPIVYNVFTNTLWSRTFDQFSFLNIEKHSGKGFEKWKEKLSSHDFFSSLFDTSAFFDILYIFIKASYVYCKTQLHEKKKCYLWILLGRFFDFPVKLRPPSQYYFSFTYSSIPSHMILAFTYSTFCLLCLFYKHP